LWAGVVAVAWDKLGGSAIPPNPSHSTLPRQGGWLRECRETRRGGISVEDLPEKCHAGSDEERNLDKKEREREREKRRSQPIETQPVSVILVL